MNDEEIKKKRKEYWDEYLPPLRKLYREIKETIEVTEFKIQSIENEDRGCE